jgi:hypothetical protein
MRKIYPLTAVLLEAGSFPEQALGTCDQRPAPGLRASDALLVSVRLLNGKADQREHCTWDKERWRTGGYTACFAFSLASPLYLYRGWSGKDVTSGTDGRDPPTDQAATSCSSAGLLWARATQKNLVAWAYRGRAKKYTTKETTGQLLRLGCAHAPCQPHRCPVSGLGKNLQRFSSLCLFNFEQV